MQTGLSLSTRIQCSIPYDLKIILYIKPEIKKDNMNVT